MREAPNPRCEDVECVLSFGENVTHRVSTGLPPRAIKAHAA